MKIVDGLVATATVRRMEEHGLLSNRAAVVINGRLPILAVSAQIDLVGESTLAQSGFDGFLEKPVDFNRLRCLLAGVLRPQCREDMYWRYVAPSSMRSERYGA